MESQSATIDKARIFTLRAEPVGKLRGFEKHHKIPTVANPRALSWVDQLARNDLNNDLQEVVDLLRGNFHFKRRHLDIHGPEDRRGVIETPFFNYEVSVDLDREDPSWIIWRREINHIRNIDQVVGQAFLSCFAKANWRLEIVWDLKFSLVDLIDRIEDLDTADIRVDYDKDLTWCKVAMANTTSTLLISDGTLQISRESAVAPRELIADLVDFQFQLSEQMGTPGIGQSMDVSPDK